MKKKQGYTFRKFINDVHLWLGIASAIVLFFVCLSGTLYVFHAEVDSWLEPQKFHIEKIGTAKADPEILITKTQEETKGKVTRITIHEDAHHPYELQVSKGKEDKRGETYYVNPYNQEILGNGKGPASEFFRFMFKMHRWLTFDEAIGRPIVGIATLIFVVLSITGIVLWFPKKIKGFKSLKPGLVIKRKANWKRINHDLHNTLGFYTCIIILIMAFTGLCWSFEWYKDGLSSVLGSKVFAQRGEKKPHSTVVPNAKALTVSEFRILADSLLPYKGKTVISIPKSVEDAVEITKYEADAFNEAANDRYIVDQFTGAVLKKDIFADKRLGEKIASQIKPIHTGDIFGLFSKISYFIVCLIATSLPITGIIIWINKLRKPKKKKKVIV